MSDEKKPVLPAESEGNEPKAAESKTTEPKAVGSKIAGLKIPSFFQVFDSVLVRDTLKLFGWIASIVIIGGLCWTLTQPVRNRFLMRAVDRVLEQYSDFRRVGELSSPVVGSSLIGSWHSVHEARQAGVLPNENFPIGTKAFIFSFVAEGTFFPCAAVVDPEGKVQEFIPLNTHGKKILARISPGILRIYTRRIEGSVP